MDRLNFHTVIMPKWPAIVQAAIIIAKRGLPRHVGNAMNLSPSITIMGIRGHRVSGSRVRIIVSVWVVTRKWRAARWGAAIVMKRRIDRRGKSFHTPAHTSPANDARHVPYVNAEQRERMFYQIAPLP